jgi:hypothetical protein
MLAKLKVETAICSLRNLTAASEKRKYMYVEVPFSTVEANAGNWRELRKIKGG